MATLSLRMRDSLKRKAQELARSEGVSLNNFINATVAAAVAQEEALTFFDARLRDTDCEALHQRVMDFMQPPRTGPEPTAADIRRAMGEEPRAQKV